MGTMELPHGHLAFVGLDLGIARDVAEAARGEWARLDSLSPDVVEPQGLISSEFSWLLDGTVAAPVTYFLPTGTVTL